MFCKIIFNDILNLFVAALVLFYYLYYLPRGMQPVFLVSPLAKEC